MAFYYSRNEARLGWVATVVSIASIATQGIVKLVQYRRTLDAQRAIAQTAEQIRAIDAQIEEANQYILELSGKTYEEIKRQENIKLMTAGTVALAGILSAILIFK